MQLFLTGMVGDRQTVWPIEGEALRIGRSSRNAIPLSDGTVSKEHAELKLVSGRWYVRDLGSRNGTRVNGTEATDPIEIKLGDRIEIGHVFLSVTGDTPTQRVRFDESTSMNSSLRIRADQILERKSDKTTPRSIDTVKLLSEAGRLLVLPRPLHDTCDELLAFVERAIPASRYMIILQADSKSEPQQVAARTRKGRADEPLALSRSILKTVMDECTSVLTGDASRDVRFAGNQSIIAQAVHSAMAVPLFDNEKVLGALYVDSSDARTVFVEDQLELLTLLANMAAVKITNARLLETEQARLRMAQELATAARIQRGLLPPPPDVPGYSVDAFIESCYEVGGDLYDFFVRPDGKLLIVAGDVTGKGMGASLLMSSFLASIRVLYDSCDAVGDLAQRPNAILFRSTDAMHFVTGFIGCLDPATGEMQYVNGGHPLPMLVLDGRIRTLDSNAPPFGVLPMFPYVTASVMLHPGELMAIYSDGVSEAEHGREFFGEEGLQKALEEITVDDPKEVRAGVVSRILAFVGDEPRADDITLILVRRARG